MFTFRTTTIIFFIFLLMMNVLILTGLHIHFVFYIILAAVYLSVSVTASFFICSGFHLKALCRRKTEHKVIAITFDDGPHESNTPEILEILKGRAKATFFCIGRNMEANKDLMMKMDSEGHFIGTHSHTHSGFFDFFSARRMKNELKRSEDALFRITGKKPLLFRPPYGVINPMLKKALASFPYHVIGFSNRSFDTISRDENKVLKRLIRKLRPGDIVLLHDRVPFAPSLLKKFLHQAAEKGYVVIGLDELLNIRPYAE